MACGSIVHDSSTMQVVDISPVDDVKCMARGRKIILSHNEIIKFLLWRGHMKREMVAVPRNSLGEFSMRQPFLIGEK